MIQKTQSILLIAILLSMVAGSVPAEDSYLGRKTEELLLQTQDDLLNDRFARANQRLDAIVQQSPDEPLGYVFKAAVLLGEMTDAEAKLHTELFTKYIDTVLSLTDSIPKDMPGRQAAWYHLCRGHAFAYKSLWESRFGGMTSAISLGFKAKGAYEDGLERDSALYDLYGGLGMYHYWKSAKAGILRWIGIFKNDKKKGIRELYLTLDSSAISSATARNALLWIWMDKKAYDSVVTIADELLAEYPDGKLFLWPKAEAYFEMEMYDSSLAVYETLRVRLAENPGNYFNLIDCDYRIGRCYEKLKEKEQLRDAAAIIHSYYPVVTDPIRRKQKNKLAYLFRNSK